MATPGDMNAVLADKAQELGFDQVGFAPADTTEAVQQGLKDFIDRGYHGSMQWMPDRLHHRLSPKNLWPEAQSVIMLGMNYGPKTDPRALLGEKAMGNISVYARGKDYHDIIKRRLKALARWMVEEYGCALKVFVDTAPVAEKPLAAVAGLGWQGKHTNMVSREFGSWLFLGAIYTDMALPVDIPHRNQCGSCHACLDACPTKAFPAPYKLDARRCISYLTIEHKGPIPTEFRKAMGNRIYGCDDCLAACPWNKFAKVANEASFYARAELGAPTLSELAGLDDATFRQVFSGSPIKRIGRDHFVRNVLIAIGNSDDPSLKPVAGGLINGPSDVVQDAARWAYAELSGATF